MKGHQKWAGIVIATLLLLNGGGLPSPARALPEPHLWYGINLRNPTPTQLNLVAGLGFGWVRMWDEYTPVPATRLPYNVLYVLSCEGYVTNLQAWGEHVTAIAQAGQGRVEAYEICNEPNVTGFWEGRPPDPARYSQMLCVAYQRIKAADPAAAVVSAGLAPVGRIQGTCNGWPGNNCGAMDERTYAQAMLNQGAGVCMDAFAYHPYGFAYPPEQDPASVENGFVFRGLEVMHQILAAGGLEETPIWATEFNWLRDPAEDGPLPGWCHRIPDFENFFGWMDVSAQTQADYLVRAFQYADEHFPWLHGMFVWNLDWHNYNWLCEASRYFSIRRYDGSEGGETTPAYTALAGMEQRPGPFAPRLSVVPATLMLLADIDEPGTVRGGAVVRNAGYRTLAWTAVADPDGEVVPTLPVTGGVQGAALPVWVDTTGLALGIHSGAITVTATSSDVLGSPARLTVEVSVVPQVWRCYLPAVAVVW